MARPPSPPAKLVSFPLGQFLAPTVFLGQKDAVGLPIQSAKPLALSDWRWMGEPEWAAMTLKNCADADETRPARAATVTNDAFILKCFEDIV